MTDSFRTDPPDRTANRRHARDADGDPELPRIIERRPKPGDAHPLPKRALRGVLRTIPLKYWHGLSEIQCLARASDIGSPFGLYRRLEKSIILYSLPEEWWLPHLSPWLETSLHSYFADVEALAGGYRITWPIPGLVSVWFLHSVFAHELGHHFDRQYRGRRQQVRGEWYAELNADLHAARIERDWWRARRRR